MRDETKCGTNHSINNKWNNTRNKHFTKHDANDNVDLSNWVVHTLLTLGAHVERTLSRLMSSHTSFGSRFESCHNHLHTIHGAPSLTRFSLSISTCSSLSFPSSSNPSCILSSTTRSSWKACVSQLTMRGRTPATSPLPSQVSSPTSWLSASLTTHQSPSPSWSRRRTKTWRTWHSASCSQRHTEDKPTTANQKAWQSV